MGATMKKETIIQIAEETQLKNKDLFVNFFSKRFPHENDKILTYVREWAQRFKSGNPEVYMDEKSLKIYKEELQ